ncbi:MAG TPA: hypothetical protein DEA28_00395 [Firmicutes bacterium]|nr:hypothetical protein [Bacillota bacterium]
MSKKKGVVSSFVLTILFFLGVLSVLFFNQCTAAGMLNEETVTLFALIGAVIDEGEGGLLVLAFVVLLITFLVRFILFLILALAKCNIIKKESFDEKLVKILNIVDTICFVIDDVAILYIFFYYVIGGNPIFSVYGLPIDAFYFGISMAAYLITRKMAKQIA